MKIEHGIPFPSARVGSGKRIFPLPEMQPGDSFQMGKAQLRSAQVAASRWKALHPGWDYTVRTFDDGTCRLWRTA